MQNVPKNLPVFKKANKAFAILTNQHLRTLDPAITSLLSKVYFKKIYTHWLTKIEIKSKWTHKGYIVNVYI